MPPTYHFLLPGTEGRWRSGGTDMFLKLARLVGEHRPTAVVVYASEEPAYRTLDEALRNPASDEDVWVFTTGIDIQMLLDRLGGRRSVYYALESGWQLHLPPHVPIVCVSRHGLSELSQRAPANPLFLLPVVLDADLVDDGRVRDIDILYLTRKTTPYLRDELVPALSTHCRVEVVSQFVPRKMLIELFNRAKVYLYDSSSSFADGVVEGFGLQPLEAIMCGCRVVSNLLGGMSEFLDPAVTGERLRFVVDDDVALCLRALGHGPPAVHAREELRARHSEQGLRTRLEWLLPELERLPVRRSDAERREIDRHLGMAAISATQPLFTEIRERGRIIASLHTELHGKVAERDATIRQLQAELTTKVAERDGIIADLQRRFHAAVAERDDTIRSLQAELEANITQRDRTIQALQGDLVASVAQRDATIQGLQAELAEKVTERDRTIYALQEEMHAKVHARDITIRALQVELEVKAAEAEMVIRALRTRLDAPVAEEGASLAVGDAALHRGPDEDAGRA